MLDCVQEMQERLRQAELQITASKHQTLKPEGVEKDEANDAFAIQCFNDRQVAPDAQDEGTEQSSTNQTASPLEEVLVSTPAEKYELLQRYQEVCNMLEQVKEGSQMQQTKAACAEEQARVRLRELESELRLAEAQSSGLRDRVEELQAKLVEGASQVVAAERRSEELKRELEEAKAAAGCGVETVGEERFCGGQEMQTELKQAELQVATSRHQVLKLEQERDEAHAALAKAVQLNAGANALVDRLRARCEDLQHRLSRLADSFQADLLMSISELDRVTDLWLSEESKAAVLAAQFRLQLAHSASNIQALFDQLDLMQERTAVSAQDQAIASPAGKEKKGISTRLRKWLRSGGSKRKAAKPAVTSASEVNTPPSQVVAADSARREVCKAAPPLEAFLPPLPRPSGTNLGPLRPDPEPSAHTRNHLPTSPPVKSTAFESGQGSMPSTPSRMPQLGHDWIFLQGSLPVSSSLSAPEEAQAMCQAARQANSPAEPVAGTAMQHTQPPQPATVEEPAERQIAEAELDNMLQLSTREPSTIPPPATSPTRRVTGPQDCRQDVPEGGPAKTVTPMNAAGQVELRPWAHSSSTLEPGIGTSTTGDTVPPLDRVSQPRQCTSEGEPLAQIEQAMPRGELLSATEGDAGQEETYPRNDSWAGPLGPKWREKRHVQGKSGTPDERAANDATSTMNGTAHELRAQNACAKQRSPPHRGTQEVPPSLGEGEAVWPWVTWAGAVPKDSEEDENGNCIEPAPSPMYLT